MLYTNLNHLESAEEHTKVLKEKFPHLKTFAVEPTLSPVLSH